jgi:hypothetical protein
MIRLLTVALALAASSHAQDYPLSCPANVDAAAAVHNPPDGWQTLSPATAKSYPLAGASFANGHPQQQAFLKPYSSELIRRPSSGAPSGTRRMTYRFSGTYDDGIWLLCTYLNTPATLFQRLPKAPTACEVTYPPSQANKGEALKIVCR